MQKKLAFFCRIPASLAKDSALSPTARLLYLVLAAHADARTGETFVNGATLECLMHCCRTVRERAQRELVAAGWLQLRRKPCDRGRWGKRIYVVLSSCQPTSAQILHKGPDAPCISDHSPVSESRLVESGSFPTSSD
jgi:helix-turn-helix protein